MTALSQDEIQRIIGVTDYQQGGSGGPKRQATEAGLIQSGYTVRVEEKRAMVGKMVEVLIDRVAGRDEADGYVGRLQGERQRLARRVLPACLGRAGLLDLAQRGLLGRHDAFGLERLLADDAVVDLLARGRLRGLLQRRFRRRRKFSDPDRP